MRPSRLVVSSLLCLCLSWTAGCGTETPTPEETKAATPAKPAEPRLIKTKSGKLKEARAPGIGPASAPPKAGGTDL
jgi:hypothetical protein